MEYDTNAHVHMLFSQAMSLTSRTYLQSSQGSAGICRGLGDIAWWIRQLALHSRLARGSAPAGVDHKLSCLQVHTIYPQVDGAVHITQSAPMRIKKDPVVPFSAFASQPFEAHPLPPRANRRSARPSYQEQEEVSQ